MTNGDGQSQLPAKSPTTQETSSGVDQLIETLGHSEGSEAFIQAIRTITMQSTTGAYPPPAMMAEYKEIDPAINAHILSEAKTQADHRRELEKKSTEASERRLDKAQRYQQATAMGSLVTAVIIVGFSLYFTHTVTWPLAVAATLIASVGIGGRPVATILTTYFAKRLPSP
jgi:uncharacterized membrane protein